MNLSQSAKTVGRVVICTLPLAICNCRSNCKLQIDKHLRSVSYPARPLFMAPASQQVRTGCIVTETRLGHNRLTVLLANEQESWHQTVRSLLEPQGVQTLSARSGREALSLIERQPIHVAVLDQQMPQLGGLQVVKIMRDMKHAPPAILAPPAASGSHAPHPPGSAAGHARAAVAGSCPSNATRRCVGSFHEMTSSRPPAGHATW